MRIIVHLSDLHFGRNDENVVQSIIQSVKAIKPDILVVSGDLTQRAKASEFKSAREFLRALQFKKIVIPGNHDIPLYNPLARLIAPFANYKKYISKNLQPVYADNEISIVGLNTARRSKITRGKISSEQIDVLKKSFKKAGSAIRILVAHHPFDLPDRYGTRKMVVGAKKNMQNLVNADVDLILGGHMHISHARSIADRYKINGKAALVVQASTVSNRSRGEKPTFNVIQIKTKRISLLRYIYNGEIFVMDAEEVFSLIDKNWTKEV